MRALVTALALFGIATLTAAPSVTPTMSPEEEMLRDATAVFQRAVSTPAAAIPVSIMARAGAVAVIPGAQKDGGLYYGVGVVSARAGGMEGWTPPAVIAFQGAIPFDLDSNTVDFVLVPQTRRGLDHLLAERFLGPLTEPLEPGPVGLDARSRVETDILAYMQFGEYFAGVAIEDWEVSELRSSNEQLYGRPYSTDDILRGAGFFRLPKMARLWREAIADYFRAMS
jgi:lipid-binding SYLF domain-containing protein